jgi:Na+/H+-dicarboxylate symporter
MREILFAIVWVFSVCLAVYLAFAFVSWQFNPSKWSELWRFAFVALSGVFGVLVALVVVFGIKDGIHE